MILEINRPLARYALELKLDVNMDLNKNDLSALADIFFTRCCDGLDKLLSKQGWLNGTW